MQGVTKIKEYIELYGECGGIKRKAKSWPDQKNKKPTPVKVCKDIIICNVKEENEGVRDGTCKECSKNYPRGRREDTYWDTG